VVVCGRATCPHHQPRHRSSAGPVARQERELTPAPPFPSDVAVDPCSIDVLAVSTTFEGAVSLLAMDTDYLLHRFLVRIASWAVHSFFTEVRVIGGENVPANGPIIVYVSLSMVAYDDAFVLGVSLLLLMGSF